MNAFSVLRHKRSQINKNICIFCKMLAKKPRSLLFSMCCLIRLVSTHFFLSPSVLCWTVPSSRLLTHWKASHNTSQKINSSKRPHGRYHPSVTVTSLVVIWPLEVYLSWSDDAPNYLQPTRKDLYMQEASSCLGEVIHTPLHTSSTFWTLLHRDSQEPPVAASWWKTRRHHDILKQILKKGTGDDMRPSYLKCSQKRSEEV